MDGRAFLGTLAGGLLAAPLTARAQRPPRWLSEIGALLTYGPNTVELHRRAAGYVGKILKGAKPADPPMLQPATFEVAIDLKAARALGLTIPPPLLQRADQVIE